MIMCNNLCRNQALALQLSVDKSGKNGGQAIQAVDYSNPQFIVGDPPPPSSADVSGGIL